jgi:uncharacterized membrane protein
LIGILLVSAAGSIVYFVTERNRCPGAGYELLVLLGLIVLSAGTASAISIMQTHTHDYSNTWTGALLFNLLLFGLEIGIIALGWLRFRPGLCNLGIFMFFLQVVTRYFDIFGQMLSSGLFFIGAGLLLVLGGYLLERSRRRLLDAMVRRAV